MSFSGSQRVPNLFWLQILGGCGIYRNDILTSDKAKASMIVIGAVNAFLLGLINLFYLELFPSCLQKGYINGIWNVDSMPNI